MSIVEFLFVWGVMGLLLANFIPFVGQPGHKWCVDHFILLAIIAGPVAWLVLLTILSILVYFHRKEMWEKITGYFRKKEVK